MLRDYMPCVGLGRLQGSGAKALSMTLDLRGGEAHLPRNGPFHEQAGPLHGGTGEHQAIGAFTPHGDLDAGFFGEGGGFGVASVYMAGYAHAGVVG